MEWEGTQLHIRRITGPAADQAIRPFWGRFRQFLGWAPGVASAGAATALGLRDLGPWWAELYRLRGDPVHYLVQLTCPAAGLGFRAAHLELDGGPPVAMTAAGRCLCAPVPVRTPPPSSVRLVVGQWDGTELSAVWRQYQGEGHV